MCSSKWNVMKFNLLERISNNLGHSQPRDWGMDCYVLPRVQGKTHTVVEIRLSVVELKLPSGTQFNLPMAKLMTPS